jgi:hypothetical protein
VLERRGQKRVRGCRFGQIHMRKPIAITRESGIARPADSQNNETALEQLARKRRPEATGNARHDGCMVTAGCLHTRLRLTPARYDPHLSPSECTRSGEFLNAGPRHLRGRSGLSLRESARPEPAADDRVHAPDPASYATSPHSPARTNATDASR